ncbi:LuxR family two component transcriptional regulator [Alkalispirillum mobile]|uniref:LuxR family two component transcriptional regulator n=1 Tax=Alkalispirillum mobile TaxID=85925 RepID=A0A498BY60_9GAMM|nr:two-component system response regulator NarL [Alkalispirillum mobile]RLK48764.1 LuxR family two component transcriptional regulator [Alkalispirillum mobile]
MDSSAAPKRVFLVDDHPLLRRGLCQLLELEPDLEVAGEAGSGEEALERLPSASADLVLLDLNMRGLGGVQTLEAIRATGLKVRVVVLTVSDAADDVQAALRAGADGYLLKDMEPEMLVAELRRATQGDLVVSPALAAVLAQAVTKANHSPTEQALDALTARENEILHHLALGQSNKLIARDLDLTEGTVKVHVKSILKKLRMHSRVEVAIWAVQHGLHQKQA